ncbi:Conserved protein [Lacticaseibacillus rhamnosus Lc 705]|nr:Conserved protein [Lacticaseibacillus rhamnosus Lc 705]
MTRSPAQGSACKDLRRNGQDRAITPEATYTPIPNRAGSRLPKKPKHLSLQKNWVPWLIKPASMSVNFCSDLFAEICLIKMFDNILKLGIPQTSAEQRTSRFGHNAVC